MNRAAAANAVAQATQALEAMAEDYRGWALNDLDRAARLLERLQGAPSPEDVRALFTVLHDIKGQGGTFGYDLVSKIGGEACNLVRARTDASAARLAAIGLMLRALRAVIENRVRGDGGEKGQRLLEQARQIARRAES